MPPKDEPVNRTGMTTANRNAWNNRATEVTVRVLCPFCRTMARVAKTKCGNCFCELPKALTC